MRLNREKSQSWRGGLENQVLYGAHAGTVPPRTFTSMAPHAPRCPREDTDWRGPQCLVCDHREGGKQTAVRQGRYGTRRCLCLCSCVSQPHCTLMTSSVSLPGDADYPNTHTTPTNSARYVDLHTGLWICTPIHHLHLPGGCLIATFFVSSKSNADMLLNGYRPMTSSASPSLTRKHHTLCLTNAAATDAEIAVLVIAQSDRSRHLAWR